MTAKSTCCNQDCNQGRTCPLRLGTHKVSLPEPDAVVHHGTVLWNSAVEQPANTKLFTEQTVLKLLTQGKK